MALLWFNTGINDEIRTKLVELYYKLGGETFDWPKDQERPWRVEGNIEPVEEIDRLMRIPTKFRRPPK